MSGREKPLILQNGVPIPQAYDKDLGDWTEYSTEHIKAIKAELALVKAELQTIKANQLSGDQKVTLSGQSVEEYLLEPTVTDTVVSTGIIHTRGYRDLRIVVYISGGEWSVSGYSTPNPRTDGYVRVYNSEKAQWERSIGVEAHISINGQGRYLLNSHWFIEKLIENTDQINLFFTPENGFSGTIWVKMLGERYDAVG